jgi:hypothetical protein
MGRLKDAAAQKAKNAARSALGGVTSAAFNDVAKAQEIAENVARYGADRVARAKAYLASPEAQEVILNAADNLLDAGPARLREQLQTARNVYSSAKAAATPEAIDEATTAAMEHPIREQVVPRLKHMVNRAAPIALGGMLGHGGAELGAAAAMALGHPGTTMANMMKSPAVRAMVFGPLSRLAPRASSAIGGTVPALVEHAEPQAIGLPAWAQDEEDPQALAAALRRRQQ